MSVHTKRVLAHLTPQFLAAELYEIIKVVEKYPDPKEIAVGDLTVEEFRKIQLTFHGSKRMLKEFCEMYVGRYLRGYCQRFRIASPYEHMELMTSTEDSEWAAVARLHQRLEAERGTVPDDLVKSVDVIVDGIQARAKAKIQQMAAR